MTFLKIPRMNSKMMSQPTSVHSVLNLGLGLNDQMDASQIADAAATAADVSYKLSYKEKLLIILIDFVNNN